MKPPEFSFSLPPGQIIVAAFRPGATAVSSYSPKTGVDYPGSFGNLLAWVPDDEVCLDHLDWPRWPEGFSGPRCGPVAAWRYHDGRRFCPGCAHRVSATAGTIFHGTRTPLTVWFAVAWRLTSQKNGVSALGLKRELGIGSEQTAWTMPHRCRPAMTRPGRDRLSGSIEVSVASRHTRCGKAGCRCQADPPRLHGPYRQWTAIIDGKTGHAPTHRRSGPALPRVAPQGSQANPSAAPGCQRRH